MMRPRALVGIGQLQFQDIGKFLLGHARPGEHAFALLPSRRADDHDMIDAVRAALFEQQGDIEQDQGRIGMTIEKTHAAIGNGGVHDGFQPGQFVRLSEDHLPQGAAVHAIRPGGAGKGVFDHGQQRATWTLQLPHHGIGIEYRHAKIGKHRCDGGFAHADGPGQTDDGGPCALIGRMAHAVSFSNSASWPSSGAASPKNSSKAKAACATSMDRPSTTSRSRSSAWRSSAVSTGL